MSKQPQAANFAVRQTSGNGKSLVKRSGAHAPDLNRNPLTREAISFYEKHGALKKDVYPIRCYVAAEMLRRLAMALGRQITVEDLRLFIGLELTTATCKISGQNFQPVWWAIITQQLIDCAARDKKIDNGLIVKVGCFYMTRNTGSDEVLVFSGYPYSWGYGHQDKPAEDNPLIIGYTTNKERWGLPLEKVNEMIVMRRQERAGKAFVPAVKKGVAGFATLGEFFKPSKKPRGQ